MFPTLSLNQQFVQAVSKPSDINLLLPTIMYYASRCPHITEMGVRNVVSTWALLATKPKKLISYDIHRQPEIDNVVQISKENNIDFTFIEADVLKVEIEMTDLLFIDTLHIYEQLKQELKLHASKARRYMMFHDTVTYGFKDEPTEWQTPEIMENYKQGEIQGLMPALMDFVREHEHEWDVVGTYPYSNGLTVLARKQPLY
jgi:hypothetical protein